MTADPAWDARAPRPNEVGDDRADGNGRAEPALFTPLTIRGVTLRNRIMVSPMCQYSSVDGFANAWHETHLPTRAVGGAAVVMAEATAVEARGRISSSDLGIWDDVHVPALRRVTDLISAHGAVPGIQLAHAGRKASTKVPWVAGHRSVGVADGGWAPVAPSPIPFGDGFPAPVELTVDEIARIVTAWAQAAHRARDAGFRIIEVHAAHGYLIHEFLSPVSNERTDRYGGSYENRARFALEVIEAIRTEWPQDLPLFVRLSATDWIDERPSWTVDDSVRLAALLRDRGADLIDCSSGSMIRGRGAPETPGFQVPFAEAIRRESGILTAAVGVITEADQANAIIESGRADVVAIGRALLADPYWPLRAARTLGASVDWPVQYRRAGETVAPALGTPTRGTGDAAARSGSAASKG